MTDRHDDTPKWVWAVAAVLFALGTASIVTQILRLEGIL